MICKDCSAETTLGKRTGLCLRCRNVHWTRRRIDLIEKNSSNLTAYNSYLFELYLKYIRRFCFYYHHIVQATNLHSYMTTESVTAISSWMDIFKLSEHYKSIYGKPINSGCPFIKIARMLYEIGVLPPRNDEPRVHIENIYKSLPEDAINAIKPFICFLLKTKKRPTTILIALVALRDLNEWSQKNRRSNLLTIDPMAIQNHYNYLKSKGVKNNFIATKHGYINKYFRWCMAKKMIASNPCKKIILNKPSKQIQICSEESYKLLFEYIKSPDAPAEGALLLALILIWGLKSEDLSFAKIDWSEGSIVITFRRRELTRKKYHYRKQKLTLPTEPKWFYELQVRFYKNWLKQYAKLKKTFPHHYLMLPETRHVRPLGTSTILSRVYKATTQATATRIPAKVLRKTCGHAHTVNGDASILSTMGWSKDHAFTYAWTPREFVSPKKIDLNQ